MAFTLPNEVTPRGPASNLKVGPAGWSYPHWAGVVYPKARQRAPHPIEYLAEYVDAVEINASFYQPLKPEVTSLWVKKAEVNPNFQFSAKLHQRFTHERILNGSEVALFKEGLWPILRSGRLGAVLMQFPWSFRFTAENRQFVIDLRRAFHEFPLVAEFRHDTWMSEEAIGMLIDYKVGFCNIDQPEYTRAMPPTSVLTTGVGYVRLHGRNPGNSLGAYKPAASRGQQHNYLYSPQELAEWVPRIHHLARHAERVFVVANNDAGGKSIVNALQLQAMLGDSRRRAPEALLAKYPWDLHEFRGRVPVQEDLFQAA
ncbi:MAG: DUF72 domain-containing protein [Bryobacteraceae bacterium]